MLESSEVKMYQTILFDLDGTITDSGSGIMRSILYATEQLGWPAPSVETLRSFIGPPLYESFLHMAPSAEAAQQAVGHYRAYYQRKGMFENHVYPGIPEVLTRLKEAGAKLYIATSKPEEFAKKIITHFDLDRYFTGVYGASMDGHRSKKADVIQYALTEAQLDPTKETIIMVGDRNHDILGAQQNGLDSIGVLYGFGEETELQEAGATFLVQSPKDLGAILLQNS
ncbi:TPA: HAD family hydrolase [Enterococcus faecalis]|uniref:HAD family hydrolase n=1 Tax=Enterococcus faecalis TaxID=1351 RepID=UPI001926007B|nr:HAD family hydrolase [Enterococcus faecalis]EHQ8831513.1 HAD family hydrolase [Enterococcus faecalis]MCD5123367.1 HAD family hydrolase [Enterococcus faecalis]MCO5396426.1 HAD family hydrolase [Enterococcus faecalis]HAP4787299.1 HAD family hydrolase [Enterococcus faecalis]HBI1545863.1 HAD family hydrolase [Enterococcus faecalis]